MGLYCLLHKCGVHGTVLVAANVVCMARHCLLRLWCGWHNCLLDCDASPDLVALSALLNPHLSMQAFCRKFLWSELMLWPQDLPRRRCTFF